MFDPAWSPEWVWLRYATFLRATLVLVLLGGAAVLLPRRWSSLRAGLWAAALLALIPLPGLRALPLYWSAHVVPPVLAAPMMAAGATMVTQSTPGAAPVPWTTVAALVWLLGVTVIVARLVASWHGLAGVARRAAPAPEWALLVRTAARQTGVGRTVRVLRSTETATPLTWGTWRPTILLPADADRWPESHRRAVLLHELAHVSRLDCLLAVLGHIGCALWWFHPGAWLAASRLRAERERACDERVLQAGVRPSDYAECLLHFADAAGRSRLKARTVTAGLLRRSDLADRIRRILDRGARAPKLPARALSGAVCAVAVALVVAVGSMRVAPRPAVLWAALHSDSWATRAWAAESIARFGDPGAIRRLDAALLHETHPKVHAHVAFGEQLRTRARPGVKRFGWPSS